MKKLTLLVAGLMLAGATYAHDCKGNKNCCKSKSKSECKKEAKADCKDKNCCKKSTSTAKK